MGGFIFDLDQTLIDTSSSEFYRKQNNWNAVYELIPGFKLYEGISNILSEINENGHKICIVTASPEIYCKKIICEFNLPIDLTVCYHDTKMKKPHPDPIHLALSKMELPSNMVISVGDRDLDIIASKSANVFTIGAMWGLNEIEKNKLLASSPNLTFDSVSKMERYLKLKGTLRNTSR